MHPDGNEDDIGLDLIGGNIEQSIPAGDSSTSGIIGVEALTLSGGVPLGAWHHVNLDVVVGPPATATVAIDSSVVLDAGALDPRFTNGAILVLFGVSGFGQTMHVDNVVVETKP